MTGMSRRSFARYVAAAGTGLALDACSSSSRPHPGSTASPYSGDLRTVALAAALENQAVSVYQALQTALHTRTFGPEIPALTAFVRTAVDHHTEHAATWNTILREAGKPLVTGTPLTGHAQLIHTVKGASGVDQLVAALQRMENQAAQTYTAAAGSLAGTGPALTVAATIAPVEAMHAAALGWVLGGRSAVTSLLDMADVVPATELTV